MKHKSIFSRLRGVAIAILVCALVAGNLPWGRLPSAQASVLVGDDFRSILGEAVNYGIVTNKFVLEGGDAQTNVAANEGTATTQTGNDLTNPVEQPFILSRIPRVFAIKGEDAYVWTNAEDASKLVGRGDTQITTNTNSTAEELEQRVNALLAHGASQSEALAGKEPTAQVEYRENSQKYVVDITDKDVGTHYVVVDEQTYAAISREASKLQIHKRDDQTLVITVRGEAGRLNKFDVNGRGADAFLGKDAGTTPQTIVWNFADATALDIVGSATGVILAPQASVTVSATSSGWLLANEVHIGSGEWHNVFQQVDFERPSEPESPGEPNDPDTPDTPENPDTPDNPGTPGDDPESEPRLVVRTRKSALDAPATALGGATYGLWMTNPEGEDTYVGSETSDADGLMHFELPTTDTATYYLLEEEAPFGFLVDPHPTDEFEVGSDEQGFYLAHEGDEKDEYVRAASESTDEVVVLDYEPTANPVANQSVHVGVSKLERVTGKVVEGAELQIVDKQTGEVVASWTSGAEPYVVSRTLDTERVYVLRETKAPEGYQVAADVEFVLHEEGTVTSGQILSGAETTEGKKNAELVAATDETENGMLTIKLYDAVDDADDPAPNTPTPDTGSSGSGSTGGNSSGGNSSDGGKLPLTGDPLSMLPLLGYVAMAIATIVIALKVRS